MNEQWIILEDHVRDEWLDYNGHMNDAEYARVFSWAGFNWMEEVGFNDAFREKYQYTIFTLESHLCYLAEMKPKEALTVSIQVLDYDEKRVHFFFELFGEGGKRAATCEQMLMGIDQNSRRPAPFPNELFQKIAALHAQQQALPKPKEAGRAIGIRRKIK
ncbi:thioesterase family protein [Pseudobacillus badius]|uniref:thioesterase family protein n=1 Tax=Bacillus badius TaxID=1455 RepID=UPI0007B05C84|nr:thioesterase family protein [Bacillus badius]KZO00195.1 3-hydroxyacyl-CoA dehydrogenase [Bacillus badius]MED0668230.1 thioesterase family protein [Bacillus badius]OCS86359.1 3-hydroxyacyl-CoA dehydrogenase [Bacillus badius]OVE52179.1 3-hydroxyacyl-CoA dehydrogenase [Bacillus badius]TDW03891.1 acyl-CoA thioester hydrolase [Bacillus badius]